MAMPGEPYLVRHNCQERPAYATGMHNWQI